MYTPDNNNNGQNNNYENGSEYRWQGDGCTYHGQGVTQNQQNSEPGSSYSQQPSQTNGYNAPYSSPYNAQPPYGGAPHYSSPQKPKRQRREKKPMGKVKKTALKIVSGVLCCALISAASIGGFTALINNGTIKIQNKGDGNSAFTITKLVNEKGSSSASKAAISGKLTPQEVAAKVIPSVVFIQNYQINPSNPFAGVTPGGKGKESAVSPTSEGSGIVASADGYIITNAHVVEGATSLKVVTSNGKSYPAKLIGSDRMTDLAVIKVNATDLTPAQFGSSSDLKVADPVMAVGNPGGLTSTVTIGYVSALNRTISGGENGYSMKCIQTDAAINPGNSGGALVNMYGQVVGINSSKIAAAGYEGLGFAIPISDAQPIISQLKQYGYVKDRAMLGISGQYLDQMTAGLYGLPSGMYVGAVSNPSIAKAGIRKGDVITKIDDVQITGFSTIANTIAKKKPGDKVTLQVTRGLTGEKFSRTITLAASTGK